MEIERVSKKEIKITSTEPIFTFKGDEDIVVVTEKQPIKTVQVTYK